jgi:hypothetical protein
VIEAPKGGAVTGRRRISSPVSGAMMIAISVIPASTRASIP